MSNNLATFKIDIGICIGNQSFDLSILDTNQLGM